GPVRTTVAAGVRSDGTLAVARRSIALDGEVRDRLHLALIGDQFSELRAVLVRNFDADVALAARGHRLNGAAGEAGFADLVAQHFDGRVVGLLGQAVADVASLNVVAGRLERARERALGDVARV